MKTIALVSNCILRLGDRSIHLIEGEEYELTEQEFATVADGYLQAKGVTMAEEPVIEEKKEKKNRR